MQLGQWNKFIFIILMWLMQNNITHLSIILFYYFYFNLEVFPLLTDSKIVNLSIGECTCNKRRCVFELCAIWGGTVLQPCRTLLTWASFALVLCREAKIQVGSGSGNFKQNRVGSVRVESGILNKKFWNFSYRHHLMQINQQIERSLGQKPAHK